MIAELMCFDAGVERWQVMHDSHATDQQICVAPGLPAKGDLYRGIRGSEAQDFRVHRVSDVLSIVEIRYRHTAGKVGN